MNTILGTHLDLPLVIHHMVTKASEAAKRHKCPVFLKHAVEHGFAMTLDPMPRRSWDLIGVAMPDGRVTFIERDILRLGAKLIVEPQTVTVEC